MPVPESVPATGLVPAGRPPARANAARAEPAGRRSARRDGRSVVLARTRLVADFLAIAALDPAVESLRAPATVATFDVEGTPLEHVADFELVRSDESRPILVDVAADAELRDHPFAAAYVAGEVPLSADGRVFQFETAESLGAEPRLTTVRLIMACRRTFVSAGDRVRILHYLDECGTGRLVDCAGVAQNAVDGVAAVLALAVEGLLAVDITRPILPETMVRRRPLPPGDPFGF